MIDNNVNDAELREFEMRTRELIRRIQDKPLVRTAYSKLNEWERKEVNRMVSQIAHDESTCEFYGINFYKPLRHQLYGAAMAELNIEF
jgi:hypothetical protein